jgi:hypothetical protein
VLRVATAAQEAAQAATDARRRRVATGVDQLLVAELGDVVVQLRVHGALLATGCCGCMTIVGN